MNIDYTVTALMFPAIPLIMTVYSNRFHTLSALIRKIHDQYTFEKKVPPEWENQLHVLNRRTNLLEDNPVFPNFEIPEPQVTGQQTQIIINNTSSTHTLLVFLLLLYMPGRR